MQCVLKFLCYICIIDKLCFVTAKIDVHVIPDKIWGVCPESKNLPVRLTHFHVRNPANRSEEVNFTFHVARNLGDNIRMKIEAKRCQSKERLDTCAPFLSLNTKWFCKFIEDRSTIFGYLFDGIKPTFKCPIVKGVYHCENCTIDWNKMKLLPLSSVSVGYYTVRLESMNDATKANLSCFLGHGTLRKTYIEP